MRPLISSGDPKKSVDISRKAELYETSSGMLTITGGKLTTWRRMAKLTVDRLVERDARDAPCRTHEIPLGQPVAAEELPRVRGRARGAYAALAARYGHAAHEVLALAAERGELAQPIVPGLPDLLAEAVLAARREQARGVADVLLRRTRLGLLAAHVLDSSPPDGASAPVRRVADVLAGELGWSAQRTTEEIERFAREARAEGLAEVRPHRLRAVDRVLELGPGAGGPLIMGVVNASPDSFSDGGRYESLEQRVELAPAACRRRGRPSSTSAASRRPPGARPCRRRGDRARGAADRARRRRAGGRRRRAGARSGSVSLR